MKASLQLKMGQSLTMTPQLQQAIRLLQLSTLDLQQEIQQALESNPMLETSEDDEQNEAAENSEQNSEENKDTEQPAEEASADWDESENGPDWASENDTERLDHGRADGARRECLCLGVCFLS
ncbi:MAG: hypothetical protein RI567_12175, partial [Marinobacter sp.]|nr:hypothetical protein [Marinobacter sp.]